MEIRFANQIQAFAECKTFEDDQLRTDEVFERFAELLIRECAKHAEHAKGMDVEFETYFKAMIFGVEEPQGWVCPKCGVDRTKAACPQGHSAAVEGKCPMIGVAHGVEK